MAFNFDYFMTCFWGVYSNMIQMYLGKVYISRYILNEEYRNYLFNLYTSIYWLNINNRYGLGTLFSTACGGKN